MPSRSEDGPGSDQARARFFREPKFLTVSTQLHLEAFVHEHQKVWSLSPTFRAEKSDTPRHLSEFWMLEAEIQTETLQDVMNLVENMIRSLVLDLRQSPIFDEIMSSKRKGQLEKTGPGNPMAPLITERWNGLVRKPWPRITYTEVIQRLQAAIDSGHAQFEHKPSWDAGLQLEHERFITSRVGEGCPIFVTAYPQKIKPFYMLPSKTNGLSDQHPTADCFDLLLPDVCEVVGGSLREHRLEALSRSMHRNGLAKSLADIAAHGEKDKTEEISVNAGNLDWYLDLRRFGSIPHGGFGLGLDRLISYLAGVHNIKDVVAWPRWYNRCDG